MPVIQKLRPQGYASIDVRRAAVKLFEEGYGYKAVAARIGLNVHTVRDWGRRWRNGTFGDDVAPRLYRYEETARELVCSRYEQGRSLGEISRETGVPKSTVKGWVDAMKAAIKNAQTADAVDEADQAAAGAAPAEASPIRS